MNSGVRWAARPAFRAWKLPERRHFVQTNGLFWHAPAVLARFSASLFWALFFAEISIFEPVWNTLINLIT
jgi:hypothetical protein